jgi:predicted secreted protein
MGQDIIEDLGLLLCIIGVNSSPACGVTRTNYGSDDEKPAKRAEREVFPARFPNIVAMDIATCTMYRIYPGAPLFSEAERT